MTTQLNDFYKHNLGIEWYEKLFPFLDSPEMEKIRLYVQEVKKKGTRVYPLASDMFKAFRLTPYSQVKIVILGQDPYHTHGVADGLAFSSKKTGYIPPSLQNIFSEVNNNCNSGMQTTGERMYGGNLERWAIQGILLLNTAFTVEEGNPGSHLKLWKPFTDEVIRQLSLRRDLIYFLWGNHAQNYEQQLLNPHKTVFKAAHPSPFSAHKGFFRCNHFYSTKYLVNPPIIW